MSKNKFPDFVKLMKKSKAEFVEILAEKLECRVSSMGNYLIKAREIHIDAPDLVPMIYRFNRQANSVPYSMFIIDGYENVAYNKLIKRDPSSKTDYKFTLNSLIPYNVISTGNRKRVQF